MDQYFWLSEDGIHQNPMGIHRIYGEYGNGSPTWGVPWIWMNFWVIRHLIPKPSTLNCCFSSMDQFWLNPRVARVWVLSGEEKTPKSLPMTLKSPQTSPHFGVKGRPWHPWHPFFIHRSETGLATAALRQTRASLDRDEGNREFMAISPMGVEQDEPWILNGYWMDTFISIFHHHFSIDSMVIFIMFSYVFMEFMHGDTVKIGESLGCLWPASLGDFHGLSRTPWNDNDGNWIGRTIPKWLNCWG